MLINTLIFIHLLFLNAAVNPVSAQSHSLIPRDDSGVNIAILTEPDGTYELAFSENGVTQGYLVETTPNSTYSYYFLALDASGLPVDPAALLGGTVSGVLQAEVQLATQVQQFGKALWDFLSCIGVGVSVLWAKCGSELMSCLEPGPLNYAVSCAPLIACLVANGVEEAETCLNMITGS